MTTPPIIRSIEVWGHIWPAGTQFEIIEDFGTSWHVRPANGDPIFTLVKVECDDADKLKELLT